MTGAPNAPRDPGADPNGSPAAPRAAFEQRLAAMRAGFAATSDGLAACHARSDAVDDLIRQLWLTRPPAGAPAVGQLALVALGGYGRRQLFPFSDIDLLLLTERAPSPAQKEATRELIQGLWDCGLKVASSPRALPDCDPFKAADPEFSLALLDMRLIAGADDLFRALEKRVLTGRSAREGRALTSALAQLTRDRHARFGDTLFHLEPNVKDAPGGLRDAHVCRWLAQLTPQAAAATDPVPAPFDEAVAFLSATRVFLHLRHGRDDNTLDWHAQDEAAALGIALAQPIPTQALAPDPALWMRAYFRHARAVERQLFRQLESAGEQPRPPRTALRAKLPARSVFALNAGILTLKPPQGDLDPAQDPGLVLRAFALVAEFGLTLGPVTRERITAALPQLSAALEDGAPLWIAFRPVLTGAFAASALREMHALGLLELILPEFHGIDALVIRDAYHRYTVDEHTFVLIGVLHQLAGEVPAGSPEWRHHFHQMHRELAHPELLYLAALLHDTGKGRAVDDHAAISAQLAATVCSRLEFGLQETTAVTRLIALHLEMSAALRRDIFDTESVRVFAEKVGTHDLLRMLTLFTYADISAVHPDALTPWKAENLWRLSMAAANQLDRSVDQDRLDTHSPAAPSVIDSLLRALGRSAPSRAALEGFLDGFPERYLRTRSPEAVRQHLLMAQDPIGYGVSLTPGAETEQLTIVSRDRPQLLANLTAVLANWGMEVLTAEAFSNAAGVVVDTFLFQDAYGTLRLNPGERDRLREELAHVLASNAAPPPVHRRLAAPLTIRREITTRIDVDHSVSTHSTLLQVVTRNLPGLLHAAAQALSLAGCSVEVALIDTESELAIDVFYVTRGGAKLLPGEADALRLRLLEAIEANAERLGS